MHMKVPGSIEKNQQNKNEKRSNLAMHVKVKVKK